MSEARGKVLLSSDFRLHSEAATHRCAVLIVDLAGTVLLRSRLGEATAGERIRAALQSIVAVALQHGGEFIKSYGDDVLAIFRGDAIAAAARVAIEAQKLAQAADLQLYAGLHFGDVEFRATMGHPDAIGQTVNIAARLHKLTEGVPGRIFLAAEVAAELPADLAARARRFGPREMKGLGTIDVFTLDWEDEASVTRLVTGTAPSHGELHLLLRRGSAALQLTPQQKSPVIGRGKQSLLAIPDPELRVSSSHLSFECSAGRWFVQDISRNGTWMRDAATGRESALPSCRAVPMPPAGTLCLGRPFSEDADGRFTVAFTQAPAQ